MYKLSVNELLETCVCGHSRKYHWDSGDKKCVGKCSKRDCKDICLSFTKKE